MSPLSLLFVALFNSILGLSVLFPILGPLGRQLGLSELAVGSFSTAYAAAQFVGSPYWGRKSEVIGRKPVLLRGILGFGATFLAFALIAQLGRDGVLSGRVLYLALLATRLLGGLLSSATLPTAQAYVADVTGRADRTSGMALIGAAFGLGIIVGPLIGGPLSAIDLLVPLYVSAGVALLNAIFVWLKLPEPVRHQRTERPPRVLPVAVRVWPLLSVGLAATVASVAMEQTVSFYFQDRLGLTAERAPRAVWPAFGVYGVVAVLAQGVLVRRMKWPPLTLLRFGVPIAALGLGALAFAHQMPMLIATMAVQGLGQSLIVPGVTAAVSLSADDHEQGAAGGVNSSAQALGRVLGPLIGTGLYEVKWEYPYLFGAALLCVVLGFLLTSRAFGLRTPLQKTEGAPADV